jgi:hypothetical protein
MNNHYIICSLVCTIDQHGGYLFWQVFSYDLTHGHKSGQLVGLPAKHFQPTYKQQQDKKLFCQTITA